MSSEAPNPAVHPVESASTAHHPAEGAKVAAEIKQGGKGQKADKAAAKKDKKAAGKGQPQSQLELQPPPEFFASRNAIFDKYKAEYEAKVACESSHIHDLRSSSHCLHSYAARGDRGYPS